MSQSAPMPSYAYSRKHFRDVNPCTLPVGFPSGDSLHHNAKVRGMPLKTRRTLYRLLQAKEINLYEISTVILEDCLEQIGPVQRMENVPISRDVLDRITVVDREYLAWVAIMENYRKPYEEHGIRKVPVQCVNCGHQESLSYNVWEHAWVILAEPQNFEVKNETIKYHFDFRGQDHVAVVPNGLSEKRLKPEEDPMAGMARHLSENILTVNGQPTPYRASFIEEQPFFWADELFKASNLDPRPGMDTSWQADCPKCGFNISEAVSFLPFLYPGGE